jgi:hypothetical protein
MNRLVSVISISFKGLFIIILIINIFALINIICITLSISFLSYCKGILAPLAKILDRRTGKWTLSYADIGPYTDKNIVGLLFLFTNLLYFAVGVNLYATENYLMSVTIEIAGLASFYYHWYMYIYIYIYIHLFKYLYVYI